jgi:cobaltochelatase CobN
MKKKLALALFSLTVLAGGYYAFRALTRPKILFLGFADQLVILAEKASEKSQIKVETWSRETVDAATKPPDLSPFNVVIVSGLRAEPYSKEAQQSFQSATNAGAKVIVLPPRQADMMRIGNADFAGKDKFVSGYFSNGGVDNWARLLQFLTTTYIGGKAPIQPPAPLPESGYYHPDAPDVLTSTEAYKAWYKEAGHEKPGQPWVALDFSQGWKTGITQGTDGLIRAFEKRNFNVAPIFGATQLGQLLEEVKPDLVVNRSHGRFFQGERGVELMNAKIDAPIIRGLTLMFEQKTIDEYQKDKGGIRGPGLSIGTVVSELDGTVEPVLIEGMVKDAAGRKVEAPIVERVERLVDRAEHWVRLRRTANANKKVAVVYFNGIGKADFTAQGMNVPRSLVGFLNQMKAAGYKVEGNPRDPEQLLKLMQARGRNVSETETGEMEKLVSEPGVTLLPVEGYNSWFAKLPATMQTSVTEAYGAAPGTFMTARRDGKSYFVIPTLSFGNVVLLPQPARGAVMDSKLAHSDKVPPTHQYLALYWWLQEGLKAHALVHYGTHGTYEFLPGRPVGQMDDDWSDRVVASLPNVYVYTMDNVGEALIAKRRGSAVLVSHQTPPIQAAQLSETDKDVADLYRETQRFKAQDSGVLKEQMRTRIRDIGSRRKLDKDLRFNWTDQKPTDEQVEVLDAYLNELDEAKIPVGMHVHGIADDPQDLRLTMAEILGKDFLAKSGGDRRRAAERVGALMASPAATPIKLAGFARPYAPTPGTGKREYAPETQPAKPAPIASGHPAWIPKIGTPPPDVQARVQRANSPVPMAFGDGPGAPPVAPSAAPPTDDASRVAMLKAAFAESSAEVTQTLRALDGRYIRPGGGGDPVRTPSALPTGRNLYGVNPAEIPTKAAWDVGVTLGTQLAEAERKRLGRWPKKIGFNLWATELVRQYGSDLAQALWLMGIKPVWDQRGIVIDLEVIPMAELKRPRIDVILQAAGQFRDSFPDRMELVDKAVRLAVLAKDGDNYVAEGSQQLEQSLKESGLSAKEARQLSNARIYSNGPGGYGTGLTGGVTNSGSYTDTKELSAEYLDRAGSVYTLGADWGKKVPKLYETALKGTDAVSISHSSNTISALTLDHYFEYSGGMVMAIRDTTGQNAAAYMADTRDVNKARVKTVEDALASDLRAIYWNKKWIEGMKKNDFSGASEIATLASNLYGWQVTKPDAVKGYMWDEVYQIYVEDREKLGLKEWFDQKNPYAFQNLTATMLETARKGYWKPDAKVLQTLATAYAQSVATHGTSGGERTTGNIALQAFVKTQLNGVGNQLSQNFSQALEKSTTGKQSSALVVGQRLVREMAAAPTQTVVRNSLLGAFVLTTLAALFYFGLRKKLQ